VQTTETMSPTPLTEAELDYLRAGLARKLPHLSCTVNYDGYTLHVKAIEA
jgi:hypothetical protein